MLCAGDQHDDLVHTPTPRPPVGGTYFILPAGNPRRVPSPHGHRRPPAVTAPAGGASFDRIGEARGAEFHAPGHQVPRVRRPALLRCGTGSGTPTSVSRSTRGPPRDARYISRTTAPSSHCGDRSGAVAEPAQRYPGPFRRRSARRAPPDTASWTVLTSPRCRPALAPGPGRPRTCARWRRWRSGSNSRQPSIQTRWSACAW